MAPVPPLTPSSPEASGTRVRAQTRSSIQDDIAGGAGSSEIVLAKLRSMVAAGKQDADTILGTIAVAAHALTGSNGAAIAMPRDGTVLCIGRSGEIAPELGDRLNVNSGISGECLRTGTMMRCDDAARDFHVDAEVCRQMGVQSIAVVPLRGQRGRVGVLEVFSAQSYAFTDEHMELLGRLAGLAEAAWAKDPQTEEFAVQDAGIAEVGAPEIEVEAARAPEIEAPEFVAEEVREAPVPAPAIRADVPAQARMVEARAVPQHPRVPIAPSALPRFGGALMAELRAKLHPEHRTEQWWRYVTIAAMGAILLILLGVFTWRAWYKASLPVSSTKSGDVSPEAAPESPDSGAGTISAIEAPVAPAPKASPARRKSASAGRTDAEARDFPVTTWVPERGQTISPASDSGTSAGEVPEISDVSGKSSDVAKLVSAAPVLPKLRATVSESLSGGVLVHKVQPIYPTQARQARVQGNVVLDAVVSEQGRVEEVKVVAGSPMLAQAAMEAVRQWRYTPYLLNGKPIKKQTRINITFIAAQ